VNGESLSGKENLGRAPLFLIRFILFSINIYFLSFSNPQFVTHVTMNDIPMSIGLHQGFLIPFILVLNVRML